MQVVIDIPESIVEHISDGSFGARPDDKYTLVTAVMDGIPLPKSHGRLIDADELKKHKYHDNNRFENAVAVAEIDWADTIIEAEREVEE